MKPHAILNSSPNLPDPHLIPLYPVGLHSVTLPEMYARAVACFPHSTRRPQLWEGFLNFLDELVRWEISGEVWIDGSFFTAKLEPKDIDLVILLERAPLTLMTAAQRDKLKSWLDSREFLKRQFHCDVYYIDAGNPERRAYWENW